MDSQKKLFQLLRSDPTADSWCKALEDILGDEDETREFAISKLGDAGEYVTGIVEFSDNQDKSRETLKEALNRLAGAWNPSARIEPKRLWYLLDIFRAHLPPSALPRILDLFDHPQILEGKIPELVGVNLRLSALHTIRKYFKDAHRETSNTYEKKYREVLLEHERIPEYADLASEYLRELNRIDPEEKRRIQ